ncbi:MAG: TIGR02757 family protein [Flavobacteriales bacterium]
MHNEKEKVVASDLADFLREKATQYETPDFLADDPISIPHEFDHPLDVEIAAWFSATLAWGNRKSIRASCEELLFHRMAGAPSQFILEASDCEMERTLKGFVHRTFQAEDAARTARCLRSLLNRFGSLEYAFLDQGPGDAAHMLAAFRDAFFRDEAPDRTTKHVADPRKGSAAKRLNMFLRWMVRPAAAGVDFGLWKDIPLSGLCIPLDVHTAHVGRALKLFSRRQNDWKSVELLTAACREIDPVDPARLDFALFGLGAIEGLVSLPDAVR